MLSFFLCFARRNETSCGVFALFLKRLRDKHQLQSVLGNADAIQR